MKRIRDFIHNTKFQNRLVLTHLITALIPFLLFSAFSVSFLVQQARKSSVEHTAQMLDQVTDSLDTYVGSIDKMVGYISLSLNDSSFFALQSPSGPLWDEESAGIQRMLKNIASSHHEVAGILLAGENNLAVSTGMSRISRDPFTAEQWYRQAAEDPDRLQLISSVSGRNIVTNGDYSADDVFSLARAVRSPVTGKVLGVLLVDVRHDIIRNSINNITIGKKGFVFITDRNDKIVYTPANDVVYRIRNIWLDRGEDRPVNADIRGGQYQIRCEQSGYTGWKTVGVFSLDEIMNSVNSLSVLFLLCLMIGAGVVLLLSFRLAHTVTKPIMKLKALMGQAENGDLTVHFNNRFNDEIGELGLSFNHMIDRINQLIHMVYEEQKNKRNAELKSLQEQIKPHFLYNTLDTISWMAREHGAPDIVRVIDALTVMFRLGLSQGRNVISLNEEIRHVSNYLYIQKIRYGEKLNYSIEIEETLYRLQVPKLILQPLVENSIYHGIKEKRGAGTIYITARLSQAENTLILCVADNGQGIPPDRLRQLNGALAGDASTQNAPSFGLFYIAERIRLSYGAGYGLKLDSVFGEGTTATVTLPADGTFQKEDSICTGH